MIAQSAMIGHNNGPPLGDIADVAGLVRRYAWRKAHKTAWRTPPIEIVRLRRRAADALGLSYKDYTSILLDRGHRPSAIFFGLAGTLMRNGALMPGAETKLRALRDCKLFVLAAGDAQNVIRRVPEICSATPTPTHGAASAADLAVAIHHTLVAHSIPPSQAIMVGASIEDQECAARAKLARFFWAWEYFGAPRAEPDAPTEVVPEATHAAFRQCRQRPGSRRARDAPAFA